MICLVASCGRPGNHPAGAEAAGGDSIRYAKGFRVERFEGYTSVEVINPWDTAKLLQRYLLVPRGKPVPEGLPKGTVVKVPLRNVVVYTSVHASMIDRLGEAGQITGVCEPEYMISATIKEGLKAGRIADLGRATSPNIEKIIDIGAECLLVSAFENSGYGQAEKLGIPIIEGIDYMEPSPLGRAEWGRFIGLLFNKREMADSIFNETERRYLELKALAATATTRPTVFSEMRYGSYWYVPGNESYITHFFKDAGGDYIFSGTPGTGSVPLAFETVLDKAIHADFWLIKYNLAKEMTYDALRAEYAPYENFDAFKKKSIFTCNTGKVPYYEETPINPDYMLSDLIRIFHPGLLPDSTLRYYRRMED